MSNPRRTRGEPDAWQRACPVRRRGPGRRTVRKNGTASRSDPYHFSIRLGDQGRLCCLVIVGVRADGTKELVAVADGTRESTDDWAELLGDLRRRGMQAPVLAVGDGALGLWAALRDVVPATRTQRCWVHSVPGGRARSAVEEVRLVA